MQTRLWIDLTSKLNARPYYRVPAHQSIDTSSLHPIQFLLNNITTLPRPQAAPQVAAMRLAASSEMRQPKPEAPNEKAALTVGNMIHAATYFEDAHAALHSVLISTNTLEAVIQRLIEAADHPMTVDAGQTLLLYCVEHDPMVLLHAPSIFTYAQRDLHFVQALGDWFTTMHSRPWAINPLLHREFASKIAEILDAKHIALKTAIQNFNARSLGFVVSHEPVSQDSQPALQTALSEWIMWATWLCYFNIDTLRLLPDAPTDHQVIHFCKFISHLGQTYPALLRGQWGAFKPLIERTITALKSGQILENTQHCAQYLYQGLLLDDIGETGAPPLSGLDQIMKELHNLQDQQLAHAHTQRARQMAPPQDATTRVAARFDGHGAGFGAGSGSGSASGSSHTSTAASDALLAERLQAQERAEMMLMQLALSMPRSPSDSIDAEHPANRPAPKKLSLIKRLSQSWRQSFPHPISPAFFVTIMMVWVLSSTATSYGLEHSMSQKAAAGVGMSAVALFLTLAILLYARHGKPSWLRAYQAKPVRSTTPSLSGHPLRASPSAPVTAQPQSDPPPRRLRNPRQRSALA